MALAVWTAVVLKALAALPLLGVSRPSEKGVRRPAWAAAVILVAHGGVLTAVALLVAAGVIHASATADHRAPAWHAYLWNPWSPLGTPDRDGAVGIRS